jgi:cyanophycinase-like exopeptidase
VSCTLKTEEAADEVFGTVKEADVVIVTGGDQLRLTSPFLGNLSRYFY